MESSRLIGGASASSGFLEAWVKTTGDIIWGTKRDIQWDIYIYMYVYICVYIYICIYICIYIYV